VLGNGVDNMVDDLVGMLVDSTLDKIMDNILDNVLENCCHHPVLTTVLLSISCCRCPAVTVLHCTDMIRSDPEDVLPEDGDPNHGDPTDEEDHADEELPKEVPKKKKKKKQKVRCGDCEGCRQVDCRKCDHCLDKKRYGGTARLKKACRRRACRGLVDGGKAVVVEEVGKKTAEFDPNGMFSRCLGKLTAIEHPDWTADAVMEESRRQWARWKEDQDKVGMQEEQVGMVVEEKQLTRESFGFAVTQRKTPFPAIKVWEAPTGGRIKVKFFVTGELVMTDRRNWRQYTTKLGLQLVRRKDVNQWSFSAALRELRAVLARLDVEESLPVSSVTGGVSLGTTASSRSLGRAGRLTMLETEAQNAAAFQQKMFLGQAQKWRCRQCPLFGNKSRMVAQRHAVLCGGRPNRAKKRSMVANLPCSVAACPEKFARKKELHAHFKLAHKELLRPYECPDCPTQCSEWRAFLRHRREVHGKRRHEQKKCGVCGFQTARQSNLDRHMLGHIDAKEGAEEREEEEAEKDSSSEAEADDEADDEDGVDTAAADEGYGPLAVAIRNKMTEMQRWANGREMCDWEKTRLNNLREQYELLVASAEEAAGEEEDIPTPRGRKRRSDGSIAASRESTRLKGRLEARLAYQLEILSDEDDEADVELEDNEEPEVEEEQAKGGKKNFACLICGKKSRDESNRRSHMERLHAAAAAGVLLHLCTITTCRRAFPTLWDMLVHRKTCVNQCRTCPFNTSNKQRWMKHIRKHSQ
jgi:hypothetical protein